MSKLQQARHWPGCISLITPRRGGTEHAYFRKGILWPSVTPRNFTTEPVTWYNFTASANPAGDFCFSIEFSMSGKTAGVIFGNYSGSPQIHIASGSVNIQITIRLFNSAVTSAYIANYEIGRTYHIEIKRSNGVATISGDASGTQIGTAATVLSEVPVSSFNGTISRVSMTDGTTENIAWSYPCESERLRLITNNNVLNAGTHFEAADISTATRIDTAIDLRGSVSSYTNIVDFEAVQFTASSQKQELVGQGPAVTTSAPAIMSLCHACPTIGSSALQISQEIGGVRNIFYVTFPALSGRHVAASSIKISEGNTIFSLYLDGVFLGSTIKGGIPSGTAYSTYTNYAVNDNRNGTYTNYFGKVYSAVLFNRALSAEQIAYLSK